MNCMTFIHSTINNNRIIKNHNFLIYIKVTKNVIVKKNIHMTLRSLFDKFSNANFYYR